jgi:isopenicillin-N epimerase
MQDHGWENVRKACHVLLQQAIERICDLTNMSPLYPLDSIFYSQMGIAPLPLCDTVALKRRLYDEHKIEVPLTQWRNRQFVRISVQGYNGQDDIDALLNALKVLLPQVVIIS